MSETLNNASLSKASVFRKAIATLVLFAVLIAIVTTIRFQYDAPRSSLFVIKAEDGGSNITVHTILPIKTGQMTLAHYVEHLVWLPNVGKGARPEDRDTNAWTANLSVGYWLSGPVTDLPAMLQQLATVFRPISLPRDYAEQERDIMMREYDLRMIKNWDAQADQELRAFLYQGNTISNSAIGTPETIKALSYDDAKALHAATHLPENAVVVVIGNTSESEVSLMMEKANFPNLNARRDRFRPAPFVLDQPETRIFQFPDEAAAPRMTLRKVVRLFDPVDFDLLDFQSDLLSDILDTNLPGGLAGPLRFDEPVARSFAIQVFPLDESHIEMSFTAEPNKGVTFEALQSAFETALTASARGVPVSTFDRVQKRFKGRLPDWSDQAKAGRWIADYVVDRLSNMREPRSTSEIRERYERINAKDIDSLLVTLAGPGRTGIALIGKDRSQ